MRAQRARRKAAAGERAADSGTGRSSARGLELLRDVQDASSRLMALVRALNAEQVRLRELSAAPSRAHSAVQDAQAAFVEFYDFLPTPYLVLNELGVILGVNRAGLDMLAPSRQWIVGRPLLAFLARESLRPMLEDVLRCPRGAERSVEVQVRTVEGLRPTQLVVRREARPRSNGATFHVVLVDLHDVRRLQEERRQAEQEREESQSRERVARADSRAKDQFLAMVSHELRTPLTPVLAAADSLAADGSLPPEVRSKAEVIRRNVKAEARLIEELLDVARITQDKLVLRRRPSDVHAVLHEVVSGWGEAMAGRQIGFEVHLSAARTTVDADAGRLAQVFRNLLSNASKFTEPGGRIVIESRDETEGLAVTVSDTGVGMSAAQLRQVFQPFSRGQEVSARRGLGLGLTISRAIVDAHGGRLTLTSDGPGRGTTACVQLATVAAEPLAVDRPQPAPGKAEAAPGKAEAGDPAVRLLLVEDDRDSAQMLCLLLASAGYEVSTARSLHAARALAGTCDVMVSDISLPDGSGLDLVREVRAESPGLPAIALSGYGSEQDVRQSLEAGFAEHLTKPVDLDVLLAAVHHLAPTARR